MLREKEFMQAKAALMPTLYKKFYRFAKTAGVTGNKKQFVEDLVFRTLNEALRLSFMEVYAYRSCTWLIKTKAQNVWDDAWRKWFRTVPVTELRNPDQLWSEHELQETEKPMHPKIEWLLEKADKKSAEIINKSLQGYQIKEIAEMMKTTPGALSQHLQRFKKRLLKP